MFGVLTFLPLFVAPRRDKRVGVAGKELPGEKGIGYDFERGFFQRGFFQRGFNFQQN